MHVFVEADGGSRGNPGPAGYGAVVIGDDGEVLAERFQSIGRATNNVAEYRGLIAGLAAAADLGADSVTVRMDSKLVVEQMSGRWQVKHPDMRPLAAQAREAAARLARVDYVWIPRAENTRADRLANQAMDAAGGNSRAVAPDDQPGQRAQPAQLVQPGEPITPADRPVKTMGWVPPTGAVPTRVVLLRHGRTAHTVESRFAGRTDLPLDDVGYRQADAAARRVARFAPVAAVVSSPLLRTRQTAVAAIRALGRPESDIVIDAGFAETDFGDWEGLTAKEAIAGWPAEFQAWQGGLDDPPPGGESFREVAARVGAARDRLLETFAAQTVVVVTHVVPIKSLLRLALGADPQLLQLFFLDPASITVIDYYPNGAAVVRTVNEGAFDLDGTISPAEPARA